MKQNNLKKITKESLSVAECDHVIQLILNAENHNPTHPAICTTDRKYSYRDLVIYVENAIDDLIRCGVEKGDIVGLHGKCSFSFIGYFLACLTLGVVSVFIDKDIPELRKKLMLEKAHIKYVINFDHEPVGFFEKSIKPKEPILNRKNKDEFLQKYIGKIKFHDPAYIFFTSGSTGIPKGVVGCHGGLNHFINWQSTEFKINESDKIAQITALSFDVILREILLPLASGATLWIPSPVESLSPDKMLAWLFDKQITVVHTVPTILRAWLLENKQSSSLNKLRYLFSAGEPLLSTLVESWRKQCGFHTEIINLYGPTETTLAKCYYRLSDQLVEGVQPIGNPISGAEVFIMKENQELCEQDEIGELVIRTPYRSLGYLDSEQNKSIFKKNKYTKYENDFLYFTGDLGFCDSGNQIRILGRKDNQVKVNGVRIELGEIEKRLYEHHLVLHAAALVCEKQGVKTLIAAVQLKNLVTTTELVDHLRMVLPQTHLPSRIMIIKAMPFTASGKVSKTELLKLLEKKEVSNSFSENFNETEKQIRDIWKKIIGIDACDLDSHLLSLGCTSIQAISIANLMNDSFGFSINYKTLMDFPTIRVLSKYIEMLSKKKNNDVVRVKNGDLSDGIRKDYPLFPSQKRFWIMQKNEFIPSELYNVYAVFNLNGVLSVEKLKSAIDTLVNRHRILQCVIQENNIEPKQCLGSVFPFLEILNLTENENSEEVTKTILSTSIDLETGPLTKFYLLIDHKSSMTFIINQHHIITDDLSLSQLISELSDIYSEVENNKNKVEFDFLDHVLNQNYLSSRSDSDQGFIFEDWKKQFETYSDIRLPGQYLRSPIFNYRGNRLIYQLDENTTKQIKTLAKQSKQSEFTLFFAAFYILLNQYSGQNDFVIGVPVSNRSSSKVESILGCFINLLPIKINIDNKKSLHELCSAINTLVASGYSNQDYLFEEVMNTVNIQHDLSRTPLYQVIFNMQPVNIADSLHFGDVRASHLEISNNTTKTDITWMIRKSENGYYLCIDYSSSLFSENNINQLAQSYETLLQNFTEGLSGSIGKISLFSKEEKNNYFLENALPSHHYQKNYDYLYSPFEEQARQNPNAIAVKASDGSFCYGELLKASQSLAVTLQQYDVKPNQLVAIYLPKSKYQVVSALGIMMSGAAYLPISVEEPVDRFANILQQAEVSVVITTKSLSKTVPDFYTVIEIDDENSWSCCDLSLLQINHRSDDLAYVIFTSGSTGVPKGVMIEHRAALNTIQDINERYAINAHDCIYGLSNLNFDLSVYDLFGTLAAGACLVLPKNEDCKEPAAWIKAIEVNQITVWNTVPALMQMLTDYAKSISVTSKLSAIRLVLLSGDWVPLNLPDAIWKACGKDTEIISLGGATEASVWSILYPIQSLSPYWKSIPYGRPMWNQQFYILNEYLDPVPQGVIGQLYIAGIGLARGYWKDEEKTNKHFLVHPETGQRIYRTGDLGRYQSDGVIEFLGRIDHQVKIRGYRIELGEIEAQINQYADIERSVVVEREGKLCAYIKSTNPICIKTLLENLKNKLPSYMLPSSFHQVNHFSLTSNGKVNVNELNEIFIERPESMHESPQNDTERLAAEVWGSVLNVNNIGRLDNFFSLGGHSLKALEVILVLKNKLNLEVSLKELFKNPILCDFANVLDKSSVNDTSNQNTALALRKFPAQEIYPLSHMQSRLWFIEKMLSDKRVYTVSALHEFEGQFNQTIFNKALSLLLKEQTMLRAVMIDEESGKQKILPEFYPEVILIDWSSKKIMGNEINEIKRFSESIVQEGFEFSNKPLWKVYQIKLSDLRSYFLFVFHHLIVDGVSLDLFFQSLSEKYNALLKKPEIKTNTFFFDYLDYIQSFSLAENKPVIQNHLDYWKNKLIGFKNYRLNLPTEKQRPPQFSFKGSNITLEIADLNKTKQIDLLAKKISCTRSVVFLGLYHLLLFNLSGQNDILTGQMLVNRNQFDLRNIIGYFSNTLVARSTIQPDQRFSDYIKELQKELLNDFAHQETPFELLVDSLLPVIDSSASPIFQHMFVYQQLENRSLNLDGITSKILSYDSQSAKFDLTFFVEDLGNSIHAKFEYYTEIFSEKTITRFINGLSVLLDSVIDNSEVRLSELYIINSEDQKKLAQQNESEHQFYKKYNYLYDPFVEQVALTPSNIAVEASDGSYLYDELLSAAQSLAVKLQNLDAKPNTLIAVYLPKSKYQVVSTLGVMMSGAAYLPISSEEAPERLLEILNQGEVDIILTCDELMPMLRNVNCTIVNLRDESSWLIKAHKTLSIHHKTTDLAYVIFTSGSTGIPKGVMIEHQAALNTIQDINERFSITASDKVYGLSALNFDLSVYDLFGTLAVGATLVLPNNTDLKEPGVWHTAIQEQGITIWNTVPALMQMLSDYVVSRHPDFSAKNIRLVLMSGDWIPLSLPDAIKKICGDKTKIISLGGATEASIWSILYPIKKISSNWNSIPYGYPMWNQRFYILNQQMDFVPQGVVGELCIAGKGLARGYWKNEKKTAESFVIHSKTGERIYKTGDLGRYNSNGIIEFLGRVDQQVKINGYRVELGEIESQIEKYEEVDRSVVIERDGKLFAYVTAKTKLNETALIQTLKNKVPHYMVPIAVMQLSQFPLTNNGKIDRKKLPEINVIRNSTHYEEPKGEVEKIVAKVWSQELSMSVISRKDNFFALGGNSLKAVSVINSLRKNLGYDISLRYLFSTETLVEFAEKIHFINQASFKTTEENFVMGEL